VGKLLENVIHMVFVNIIVDVIDSKPVVTFCVGGLGGKTVRECYTYGLCKYYSRRD